MLSLTPFMASSIKSSLIDYLKGFLGIAILGISHRILMSKGLFSPLYFYLICPLFKCLLTIISQIGGRRYGTGETSPLPIY